MLLEGLFCTFSTYAYVRSSNQDASLPHSFQGARILQSRRPILYVCTTHVPLRKSSHITYVCTWSSLSLPMMYVERSHDAGTITICKLLQVSRPDDTTLAASGLFDKWVRRVERVKGKSGEMSPICGTSDGQSKKTKGLDVHGFCGSTADSHPIFLLIDGCWQGRGGLGRPREGKHCWLKFNSTRTPLLLYCCRLFLTVGE